MPKKHKPVRERPPHVRQGPTIFQRMWRIQRVMAVITFLLIAGIGLATLAQGKLIYYNYRRLAVFAPFAIFIGALGLLWVIVGWQKRRSD